MAVHIYSPHYYTIFHYGTADHGASPYHALIIMQSFIMGLQTFNVSIIKHPFHYGTADCGGSPFNVLIIIKSFSMELRTTVVVFLPLFPGGVL